METLEPQKIPQGDADLAPAEEKFPISLPDGLTSEDVKSRSKEFRKIWKAWADKQMNAIETYQKMFMSQMTGPQKSKSTAVLSIASGIVETLTARCSKAIWGRDKLIDVISLDTNKSKEEGQIVEDFLNQELIYVSRGTKKGKSLIKSALIDGVGMWREKWEVKTEKRSNPIYQQMPDGSSVFVGEGEPQEISYSCWNWEEKDTFDICFDPGTKDTVAESPWTGIRTHMSLSELKKWEAQGIIQNVDQIATITPSSVTNSDDWETKRKNSIGGQVNNFQYANHKEYKVDEWFGNLIWETEGEPDLEGKIGPKKINSKEFHWIIVEEQVLVLFEDNQLQPERKPVGSFPIIIDPRKVFGKSSLQDVMGIQQMVNTFSGKQADLVELAANRPTYYDKRSGLSGRTAYQRTQGMIAVNDVNGIKEGNVDTSAIMVNQNFIQFLIEFARNLTAATEQAQGLDGAGTATEFNGLMQLVGTRFEDLADNIIQFLCVPMAQGCLDFYQQLGVDGQMAVRSCSIDGETKPVTRQMLQGRWQIIPSGMNSQANKEARTKNSIELMKLALEIIPLISTNPALSEGQYPNIKELFNESLTLMDYRQTASFWTAPQMPTMPGMPGPMPPGMGGDMAQAQPPVGVGPNVGGMQPLPQGLQ